MIPPDSRTGAGSWLLNTEVEPDSQWALPQGKRQQENERLGGKRPDKQNKTDFLRKRGNLRNK